VPLFANRPIEPISDAFIHPFGWVSAGFGQASLVQVIKFVAQRDADNQAYVLADQRTIGVFVAF
jgi:hypothetical protein